MNLTPPLIRKPISNTGALSRNLLLAALLGGFGLQSSAQTFRSNHQLQIGRGASINSTASVIPVPGKANPWMADATTAAGGDTAPAESPVIVSLVDFVAGDELVFTATGGTSYAGGVPSPTADGDLTGYRGLFHLNNAANGGPENNIGGLNSPANSLVGVFLGPNPSGAAPTTFYDFSPDPVGNVPGSIDYTTLAPPIAKPFFIGDGVNSSDVQQRITVPFGATRLVLGSMDGAGWYNNTGSFSVTVALAGEPGDSDLRATLSAPASITIGSNITYQFRIHNGGPSTATGVKVSFQPSGKESFVSATVPYTVQIGGPADGYYLIDLPDLTSGATNNFNFVFKANVTGQITLAGGSSSTSNDPNGGNNGFVANTNATVAPPPPPPAHGGLSATALTVNESRDPSAGLADTALRFAAAQLGTPAHLVVRVQYSTVAGNPESSWQDLANGDSGHMTYNPERQQFYLSSLNYPPVNGVSFRAISSASGYTDSISNKVGPFNLNSSKPRLSSPLLSVTGNGPFADLYFRTYSATSVSGMAERIQQSTTPFDENSWQNLGDNHSGAMTQTSDPKRFYLLAGKIPAVQGVYFRAITSRTGYADGISKPNGPFNISLNEPPTVTSLTVSPTGSGTGQDHKHPMVLNTRSLTVSAAVRAASGRSVKTLKLLLDGSPVYSGSQIASVRYTINNVLVGDHVIEAVGIDDRGAEARLGTKPFYVRVNPTAGSAIRTEHTGDAQTSASATVAGKVFTAIASGGDWRTATTWRDAQGKTGIPGRNDLAIVGSATVTIGVGEIELEGLSISGGQLRGVGGVLVYGQTTISGAIIDGVAIAIARGGVCELINSTDIQFRSNAGPDGQIFNNGTCNIHGAAGISGLPQLYNVGTINFQPLLAVPTGAGQNPALDNRAIIAKNVSTSGLVSSALTSLITNDGGSLITNDGGSIVAQGGGNIVAQGGGNIVAQGGGNIIGNDGASIVAQGGGNIISTNGSGIHAPDDASFEMETSTFSAEAAAAPAGFVQSGGEVDLSGITITGPVTLNGGVLSGSGSIVGSLTNNSGYIMPGHSTGAIAVTGNFKQGANGSLVLEEGGKLQTNSISWQCEVRLRSAGTFNCARSTVTRLMQPIRSRRWDSVRFLEHLPRSAPTRQPR